MCRKCVQQHGNMNTGHVIKVWCCKAKQVRPGQGGEWGKMMIICIEDSIMFNIQCHDTISIWYHNIIMSCCYDWRAQFHVQSFCSFMSMSFTYHYCLLVLSPVPFRSVCCVELLVPTLRKKLLNWSSSSFKFQLWKRRRLVWRIKKSLIAPGMFSSIPLQLRASEVSKHPTPLLLCFFRCITHHHPHRIPGVTQSDGSAYLCNTPFACDKNHRVKMPSLSQPIAFLIAFIMKLRCDVLFLSLS